MSGWLDVGRSFLGIAPSVSPQHQERARRQHRLREAELDDPRTHEERLEDIVQKLTADLTLKQYDREEAQKRLDKAIQTKNRPLAEVAYKDRERFAAEEKRLRAQLQNNKDILNTIRTSKLNLEQGMLLRSGASTLEDMNDLAEELDVEGAMDDVALAMEQADDLHSVFATPIRSPDVFQEEAMTSELDQLFASSHSSPQVSRAVPTTRSKKDEPLKWPKAPTHTYPGNNNHNNRGDGSSGQKERIPMHPAE